MKVTFLFPIVLAVAALIFGACDQKEQAVKPASETATRGEALFKQHCSPCHPNGDNIINSKKTLHREDLEANGVKTADDIVGKMRNPGVGMTPFDKRTIPDSDARETAEYVLRTFK
jgi:cytochrome c6